MLSWCFMKHQENGLATQTLIRKVQAASAARSFRKALASI